MCIFRNYRIQFFKYSKDLPIFLKKRNIIPYIAMTSNNMLSVENAKAALRDIITALSSDHTSRLNEAKTNAGNDMLMYMQLVFPLATQIQQDIIQNYGFPADREGLLQFTHIIKMLEKDNEDILQMNDNLRSLLLPSMVLPYPQSL